jgi:hypothetical protein
MPPKKRTEDTQEKTFDEAIPEIINTLSEACMFCAIHRFLAHITISAAQKYFFVPQKIKEKRQRESEHAAARKKKKESKQQEDEMAGDKENNQDANSDGGQESIPFRVVKVTTYIEVIIPSLTQPKGRGKPTNQVLTRGPFFFETDISYDQFKLLVAQTLPAPPANLNWSKITWKYDVASCTPKPIADSLGYEAMVVALRERQKNHVIKVLTPPPAKSETVRQRILHSQCLGCSSVLLALVYGRRQRNS